MLKPLVAGLVCALAALPAFAQSFPARPLRLVVPYAAGGSTDVLARIVGQKLTENLGQAVVIDNRTGAGTLIATGIVAHAAPDGYTLLMATPPLVVADALYKSVPFDVARDFAPVTNVAATSNVLVVHPSVTAQSARELIAMAKAQPGKFAYGSSGVGGASHLAVALFASMAGIELLHVPYKGGALAVTDLLGGRLSLMFANLTTVQPHIKSGKVRALAIGTAQRSQVAPELQTVAEAGVAGYEANNWNGVVAPAKTPRPIIDLLQREIQRVVAAPDLRVRLLQSAFEPVADTPEAFRRYLETERVKWSRVVREAGIKPE
ncbi:MAG: tripartite tricarboxylate transporter substrate binding protein [Betaproteobacteria bacterium]|nr:tripartite tricarboxylate transporter substrate binding protein [Betaproteobacteria bacterium]